jgi:hypothetical protein
VSLTKRPHLELKRLNAWELYIFCKLIILHDFVRNWPLKKCDPYMAAPVWIKVQQCMYRVVSCYFLVHCPEIYWSLFTWAGRNKMLGRTGTEPSTEKTKQLKG